MNVLVVLEKRSEVYKKYNVNPDIAIFGKALGNGYPITAIIGTKEIMNSAQNYLSVVHFGQIESDLQQP